MFGQAALGGLRFGFKLADFRPRREIASMQRTNSYIRTIFPGLAIGMSILLGGCQGSGQQAVAEDQPAVPPANSTTAASAQVSPYTPGAAPAKPLSSCNLEAIGTVKYGLDPIELAAGRQNAFKGWVDASQLTQPSYWLRFDDKNASRHMHVRFDLTVKRADVVAADPNAPLVSGFTVSVPANALPVGQYHVYLAVQSGGAAYICDNGRYVKITP